MIGTIDVSGGGFDINGESNLDLQYAMGLVGHRQDVTLYQVGDEIMGGCRFTLMNYPGVG